MANRLEGTASFTFEEAEYHLIMNNRVLLEAEDVLGYSALDAAEQAKAALDAGRNPMLRTVIALFYGALVQNHPALAQDDAIDMFMGDDPAPQEAFKQLLMGTQPPAAVGGSAGGNGPARKAPAKRAAKKPRGTGTKSSGSTAKRASRAKTSG